MIFFTPTVTLLASENHQRVGIYVADLGSGGSGNPWDQMSIRIHDPYNNLVGDIVYKDYAEIIVGWNYFEIPVELAPGSEYHYHVLIHGRDGSSPTIQTATGDDTSRCYVEMYKPYTGMYKDTDVINIITSTGTSLVSIRTSTGDPVDTRSDQSTLDIMGVDLSDDTEWTNWEYETYIGVDVKTGRIKFPSGYDANDYYIEFNAKQRTSDFDAKTLLRHGEDETVEDTFRRLTYEAYGTIIQGDGTVAVGDVVRIDPATGYGTTTTYGTQLPSIIGICCSIPTINKLGYSNPIEIATRGVVVLNSASGAFNVGDELYVITTGIVSSITAGLFDDAKRLGVIMEILDSTHMKLFIT